MKNQSEAKPKEQSKIDNPETPENIVCIDFAPASNLIFEQLVCHDWTFIFSLILLLLI
jgi:hypothetical protein